MPLLLNINHNSSPSHWLCGLYTTTATGTVSGDELMGICSSRKLLSPKSPRDYKFCVQAFARNKSLKNPKKIGQSKDGMVVQSEKNEVSSKDEDSEVMLNAVNVVPSRSAVIRACTVTCGLMAALGLGIRQASHVASMEGLPIRDSSMEVSFGVEMWHLELVVGIVVLISSCRYLLIKTWPDFAQSTEAANREVLSSLEPLDYVLVSFFPGVSEELLFRGAFQPLFGMDWKSVIVVAAIFGVLHISGGRKYSFGLWAAFVGIVYGYSTIISGSIIVPMASHALNNLVGGISWRKSLKSLN